MPSEKGEKEELKNGLTIFKKYLSFRSSIYARVIYITGILTLFLFIAYGAIFKSVYEEYVDKDIRERGNSIGTIIEGSLYHSMLQNDKSALQSTLDIINTLPGIDEVNLYNHNDSLVYSMFSPDSTNTSNPNCVSCHTDFDLMFPQKEKSYRIIDFRSACNMNQSDKGHRQLMVRMPILNASSCYLSSCHAHSPDEEVLGSLIIKIPLDTLDSSVSKSSTQYFILATIITLILFSLLLFFTIAKIRKPLNAIVSASEAVSKGERNRRLEIHPYLLEDMRMVSVAFNNMLDNLEAANKELENWSQQLEYKVQKKSEELSEIQNELIHIERITSLGKLSSSVAHEINNPLSGILTYTKLITKQLNRLDMDETTSQSIMKYLRIVENETKRCGDIVKGLLDFSRKDQENFENIHLHQVLRESYDLMAHQMRMADIHFYTDLRATSDLIYCNENQIKQVCVALLVNSSEAVSENGEIIIQTTNPDDAHIRFSVIDNGVGIAPDDISKIFQPFFSTKQKMSGIGLGLAIVHGIIQSHKGKIEVDTTPGKGTTVSIILSLAGNRIGELPAAPVS